MLSQLPGPPQLTLDPINGIQAVEWTKIYDFCRIIVGEFGCSRMITVTDRNRVEMDVVIAQGQPHL